jgi:hypothetical protein
VADAAADPEGVVVSVSDIDAVAEIVCVSVWTEERVPVMEADAVPDGERVVRADAVPVRDTAAERDPVGVPVVVFVLVPVSLGEPEGLPDSVGAVLEVGEIVPSALTEALGVAVCERVLRADTDELGVSEAVELGVSL